ncbi:MAG: tol-pal system protein YbgF [Deltaproteobacteria bacterium]|nr:tol-pal system protein YbgF [Deltaproteobacteria bacterium]
MLNVRKYLALWTILLLPYAVSGCGPGFPIMTAEQQAMVKNVDTLLKENESLKVRVSSLERGGGQSQSQLKTEVDAARRSAAEANSSIARLREEFSFVQGSIEEGSHGREEMKDSVKSINGSLKAMRENIASLENASKDADRKTEELKTSVESIDKKTSSLQDAAAALDKRVAAIESKPPQGAETHGKKGPGTDPEELYARGVRDVESKDYPGAMEAFQGLLADYPAHKYAGNAQYWIAEIHYARGEWERAILEFDKVIKNYPKSEKVAASILKQGFSFENLGSKKEARVLLESVIERFPKSPEAAIAKKRLQGLK